ncbi:MAG: hypothetical protein EOM54_06790 [Clostridia bacterium]|nr:hypothetical protein [Clostridia bacterium]
MDNSKIKNLIILILLIVNVFLLAVMGVDKVRNDRIRKEAVEGVVSIMASKGIEVSDDVNLSFAGLDVLSAARDLKAEKRRISAVLGKVSVDDLGANILYYQGEYGQAEFRGSGSFDILMNEGAVSVDSDAEATARNFLKKLGISAMKGENSAEVDFSDGAGTVVLSCRSGQTEIINCKVTFTFQRSSLIVVTGTRPLDDVSADVSGDELDFPTVLMHFMDIVSSSGHIFSELKDAELCYMQNASVSGTGVLTPVWRLVTDAGEFYINGLTGKQETVS